MAKRKKQKTSKSPFLLKSFFILGIIFITFSLTLKASAYKSLSFANEIPASATDFKKAKPARIYVQGAGIELPVFQTTISNNTWQISDKGASHLITSASPGENGNIIIYAHNTTDRFGNLKNVKKGENIRILSTDGGLYTYKIENIQTVGTDRTDLLYPTKNEILTIYTCDGFADLKRLVIQAKPVIAVSKSSE